MSPEALAAIRAQLDEQRVLFVVGQVYACDNCMGVSDADREAGGREPWPAHGPECSWGAVAALLAHIEALEERAHSAELGREAWHQSALADQAEARRLREALEFVATAEREALELRMYARQVLARRDA